MIFSIRDKNTHYYAILFYGGIENEGSTREGI